MSPLLQVLSHVVWGQHLHRAETCLLDCLDRPFSRHLSPWPSAGVSLSFGICSGALPATLRQGDFSRLLHPPPPRLNVDCSSGVQPACCRAPGAIPPPTPACGRSLLAALLSLAVWLMQRVVDTIIVVVVIFRRQELCTA